MSNKKAKQPCTLGDLSSEEALVVTTFRHLDVLSQATIIGSGQAPGDLMRAIAALPPTEENALHQEAVLRMLRR